MQYRQRHMQTIDAIQWTGDNLRAVQDLMAPFSPYTQTLSDHRLAVNCRGEMKFFSPGAWILKFSNDTCDTCDIMEDRFFRQIYEPVPELAQIRKGSPLPFPSEDT